MKRFSFIVVAVLVAVIALLWIYFKPPSDQQIQGELAGTWVWHWGPGLTTRGIIAPDGSSKGEVSGLSNGKTVQSEGTLVVKGGTVITTQTNGGQTIVLRWHIIRLNSHELVWSNMDGATEPVLQKFQRFCKAPGLPLSPANCTILEPRPRTTSRVVELD
jgi:hypothetical protein